MTESSLITQGLRELLGKELEPDIFEVEKGHIRRFADAVGDSHPRFRDPDYARNTPSGAITAPPAFLLDIGINKLAYLIMARKPASTGFLNGGIEIEYYQPILVGDLITSTAKLVDLQEKNSKKGKLLLMTVECIFRNQKGEKVRKMTNTFIAPQN